MKFNEVDQEIFNDIIKKFILNVGVTDAHIFFKELYRLHRELDKKLDVKHIPIPYIYFSSIKQKMKTPINKGGYSGMQLKEIATKEDISQATLYKYYQRMNKVRCKKK